MYKRGFVIFGVVSLTMGNSVFPFGDRLIGHAEFFRQLFLCQIFLPAFLGNVTADGCLIR